jgi:5-methyltetrahydrofolate--homocysteine methyltransferase
VRREFWGYAADEQLTVEEEFKVHYRGIRPAIGYPSLPDQKAIFRLAKLLPFDKIGITLTENGAMLPTASVAGLYFAHPQSKYFMTGKITEEQLLDYAVRNDSTPDEVRRFLIKNVS